MSDVPASPTGLTVTDHGGGGDQTFTLTSRLVLAANTTLQLTFLFAYLYLRANNFNGMWHPSGVSAPPEVLALVALLVGGVIYWGMYGQPRLPVMYVTMVLGLLGWAVIFLWVRGLPRRRTSSD